MLFRVRRATSADVVKSDPPAYNIRMGTFGITAWRITLLLAAAAAMSQVALADFYLHPWEDFHSDERRPHLVPSLRFYHSSTNFDANGSEQTPGTLTSYSRIEGEVAFLYSFNP